MDGYPINHCAQARQIKAEGYSATDLQEEVVARAGVIIDDALTGTSSEAHQLEGVELIAKVVARSVMENGAAKLCGDFDIDLGRLAAHASSVHVSYC